MQRRFVVQNTTNQIWGRVPKTRCIAQFNEVALAATETLFGSFLLSDTCNPGASESTNHRVGAVRQVAQEKIYSATEGALSLFVFDFGEYNLLPFFLAVLAAIFLRDFSIATTSAP